MGNSAGDRAEREFARILYGCLDFQTMRGPSSGSAPRPQPDVLGAKNGVIVAAEVKYGDPPRNPDAAEVDDLLTFGDAFHAASIIAVRYKRDRAFYLAAPQALERTDDGNYSIPSDPSDLPFSVHLRYQPDDSDVGYTVTDVTFVGTDEVPQLTDWLDAVAASQAGFEVRGGILDAQRRDDVLEGDD